MRSLTLSYCSRFEDLNTLTVCFISIPLYFLKIMKKFTFNWLIENFSKYRIEINEGLDSPPFFVEIIEKTTWNLEIFPSGNEDSDFIIILHRSDNCNGPESIALNYELSILNSEGRATASLAAEENKLEFKIGEGHVFRLVFGDHKNKFFASDILNVRCTMWIGKGEIDKEDASYARTRIGFEKISFVSITENFCFLSPNQKKVFELKSVSNTGLKLSGNVYIDNGPDSEEVVYVEIFTDSTNMPLITCQIYLINSVGKEIDCGILDIIKDTEGKCTFIGIINPRRKNLLDKKHEYLPNNSLMLRCECTLSTGVEFQRIEGTFYDLHLTPFLREKLSDLNIALRPIEPKSISDDLRALYRDQVLSDVQLKTVNKSFPAHKSVLCARSPVFGSMLTTNMKEKRIDCIQVDDLDDSTMDKFLLFLYTDVVEDLQWESALKIYYAADKYSIQRLKDICSSFLVTRLDTCNVIELLNLADRHQDSSLKADVKTFICNNKKTFFTDKWENFMQTNPQLAMKMMHFYLKMGSE